MCVWKWYGFVQKIWSPRKCIVTYTHSVDTVVHVQILCVYMYRSNYVYCLTYGHIHNYAMSCTGSQKTDRRQCSCWTYSHSIVVYGHMHRFHALQLTRCLCTERRQWVSCVGRMMAILKRSFAKSNFSEKEVQVWKMLFWKKTMFGGKAKKFRMESKTASNTINVHSLIQPKDSSS